jgi:GNAT superfamily N-acetyltransferase
MAELRYRLFDQHTEDPEPIFALFQAVRWDAAALRRRWSWEFLDHPEPGGAKIFLAEDSGRPVGMTARLPCTLKIEGQLKRAYFAADSLVLPEYRGRRIIRDLYKLAAAEGDVQLSRATLPAMNAVLEKMGYLGAKPDTFQVCLLRPVSYAIARLFGRRRARPTNAEGVRVPGEFARVSRFGAEFDRADHPLTGGFRDGVVKTGRFLNWRYLDIPHRDYHVFARRLRGDTVSLVVLRFDGVAAQLVDIRWAEQAADEPATAIRFAKAYSRAMGMVTVASWSNGAVLRGALRRRWFFERSESGSLSYHARDARFDRVDWQKVHFVHGDGDVEY